MLRVGYVHVNEGDSSKGLQKQVLESEGCTKIFNGFSDEIDFERPDLVKAVRYMEKNSNNCLFIYSLEKLAFTLENLCDILKVLRTLDIPLRSLEEDIFIRNVSDESSLMRFSDTSELKLNLDEKTEKSVRVRRISFDRRFLIKYAIISAVLLVILSGVYYWLLTRYDNEEISGPGYISINYDNTN